MAMNQFTPLSDTVSVSPQISAADVVAARKQGFVRIINNRPDGEASDQPSGEVIAAAAAVEGMSYVAIPIGHSGFSMPQIEAMRDALETAGGPVLAYCRSGTRSTLLWALTQASTGQDIEALADAAARAGYDTRPVQPAMKALSEAYGKHAPEQRAPG